MTPFQYYQAAEFKNIDLFFLMNRPEVQNVPFNFSMFSFEERNCILSTVKKAEKEEAVIVRIYNPDDTEEVGFTMVYNDDISDVKLVKFDEETIIKGIESSFRKEEEHTIGKNPKSKVEVQKVRTCQALSLRLK